MTPRVDAHQDRGPEGQVQAAEDAEDQGEAETEQGVGGAQHHPVDEGLDEIHHGYHRRRPWP
jgi:hypothetical protein